ncbi:hypothetical protein VTK56DRAFT_181 [Thermocarpiscus australiensis]
MEGTMIPSVLRCAAVCCRECTYCVCCVQLFLRWKPWSRPEWKSVCQKGTGLANPGKQPRQDPAKTPARDSARRGELSQIHKTPNPRPHCESSKTEQKSTPVTDVFQSFPSQLPRSVLIVSANMDERLEPASQVDATSAFIKLQNILLVRQFVVRVTLDQNNRVGLLYSIP